MCLKLEKYISEVRGISIAEAAREMGEDAETVRVWIKNGVTPRPDKMKRVCEWSNGFIEPSDFYNFQQASGAGEPAPETGAA